MPKVSVLMPIFTSYAVRNSRSLIRRKKIKRLIIRALTVLIPTKNGAGKPDAKCTDNLK